MGRGQVESEWLRETLHKWLDDEYCPEPANMDISNTAARSYQECLTAKQSDVGEILMKMVGDLQELSYQESFHGAFSAANVAVRLITQRMESSYACFESDHLQRTLHPPPSSMRVFPA